MRSFSNDKAGIEKQLDKVAEKVTEKYAREICARATFEEFEYLNEFLTEGA